MPLENYRKRYPAELNIAAAGTAVSATFSENVDVLSVLSAIAIWLDESDVTTAGDAATLNARVRVEANNRRFIPWHADSVKVVNAVGGETGMVYVEGWVL